MSARFLAYRPKATAKSATLIGLLSQDGSTVQPLQHPSTGEQVHDFFDVIEQWDVFSKIAPSKDAKAGIALSEVEFAAPLLGRDVMAVGKNYVEHAKEFNKSGYDSSDKKDLPEFPVIFTKRASSIVAHDTEIYPHPSFTSTLDYEGELGVIIGKAGAHISKEDAMNHVWGYTIINDVTARERQRDHKQFFIGKSLDTFCPVGPYLVPKSGMSDEHFDVVTKVNGQTRQSSNTSQLIFDIPTLINTISAGITLQPGDMIATGTPAGVGFGLDPPRFLQPGDVVEVSITGLGTLRNKIGAADSTYPAVTAVRQTAAGSTASAGTASQAGDTALVAIANGKKYHVERLGLDSGPPLVFIHGLGGNLQFFRPIVAGSGLEKSHRIILLDWEGHGLTPLSSGSSSKLSVTSLAEDVVGVLDVLKIDRATIIAHSLGGLIANTLAAAHPDRVSGQVLLGPVKALGQPGKDAMQGRAASVREKGMLAVADTICNVGLSEKTKSSRPLTVALTRSSLMSTSAEGYAQACLALGGAADPDYSKIVCPTLLVAGAEDKTSPSATIQALSSALKHAQVVTLQDVGHWHAIEDVDAVSELLKGFASGK